MAIVGGVLSGVFALVVASIFYFCLNHRRRRAQERPRPIPVVTQALLMHQRHIPAKLAGQGAYNAPHDEPAGANLPASSQHIMPLYHSTHSRLAMPLEVLYNTPSTALGTSQGPPMSASVPQPPASLLPGRLYSPSDRNQAISSLVDVPAEQGLVSRPYSLQSLPPPYTATRV
jgi:hypothetical protein